MWENDSVRAALLAGAAARQPKEVRMRALGTLLNLALATANKVPMWENDSVRAVLLAGGCRPTRTSAVRGTKCARASRQRPGIRRS